MEQKIIFLILALLCLYLVTTETGRKYLRRYVGVELSPITVGGGGQSKGSGTTGGY